MFKKLNKSQKAQPSPECWWVFDICGGQDICYECDTACDRSDSCPLDIPPCHLDITP